MLRWFSLLLLSVLVVPVSASADEWKKDYSPSGKPVIRVDANDADIRVNDWDRKDIEARIITEGYKIGPDAVRVTESQSGNQITLEVHTPRLLGLVLHRHSVRVEVSMPRQGDLNLHTGDGDIRVVNISGDFRVDSGDGNLEIRSADGTLNAETRDGNIRTSGRFDTLTLHTGDGNIDAEAEAGSKSTSGWNLLRQMGRPKRELRGERSTAAERYWNCGPEMGILTWRRVERVWITEKPRSQRGLMRYD